MVKAQMASRTELLDLISSTLLGRSAQLSRVIIRLGTGELTRAEIGVLGTLESGPKRITELARSETMAQPTISKLIDRLETRQLVTRVPSPTDGRVVLVSISETGQRQLAATRKQLRTQLRRALPQLDDDDLATLASASEVLERLIAILQRGTS